MTARLRAPGLTRAGLFLVLGTLFCAELFLVIPSPIEVDDVAGDDEGRAADADHQLGHDVDVDGDGDVARILLAAELAGDE